MREMIADKWAKFRQNLSETRIADEKWFLESGGGNEAFATGFASAGVCAYYQEAVNAGLSLSEYLQTDLSSTIANLSDAFAANPIPLTISLAYVGALTAVFAGVATIVTKANMQRNSIINACSKKLEDSKIAFKEGAKFTASTYPKFNFLMAKANAAFAGAAFAASTYTDEQSASRLLIAGAAVTAINSVRECLKGKENFNRLRTLALG